MEFTDLESQNLQLQDLRQAWMSLAGTPRRRSQWFVRQFCMRSFQKLSFWMQRTQEMVAR
jgi:hypothetical protein